MTSYSFILKSIAFVLTLFLAKNLQAQETTISTTTESAAIEDTNKVHTYVAEWPEYIGGQQAMYTFIGDNVVYPEDAQKIGAEGTVIVGFTVSKTGQLEDVYILKGVYPSLDEEAIRVVELMPNWKPGKNNGVPAKVKFALNFNYQLKKNKFIR